MIPTLWGVHVLPISSLVTARPLRLPRCLTLLATVVGTMLGTCVIVGHVWSNNVNLDNGQTNMVIGMVMPTIVYSIRLTSGAAKS